MVAGLSKPPVQEELKLSEEQRAWLAEVLRAHRAEEQKAFGDPAGAAPPVGARERETRLKRLREREAQALARLSPAQVRRLRQIHLQQTGAPALMEEEVAREVGLSERQRQQLQAVWDRYVALPLHRFQGHGREPFPEQGIRDALERLHVEMLGVLTRPQRERFFAMLGPTYPPLAETYLLRERARSRGER